MTHSEPARKQSLLPCSPVTLDAPSHTAGVAYAKAAGIMFDTVHRPHDHTVSRVHQFAQSLSVTDVA